MNQVKILPKRYKSVAETLRDLCEDKAFAEEVIKQIEARQVIHRLMALRSRRGLSQGDIAAKMKCTQSRISKLENGKDDDLRLGDFHAYADALGLEMTIVLADKRRTVVDDIKHHALEIQRLFGELEHLAEKDEKIAEGVKNFIAGETAYNLINILLEAVGKAARAAKGTAKKLRPRRDDAGAAIQMEVRHDESADGAALSGTCARTVSG